MRLLPQLPVGPGPHTGVLPSHQQEGTESGDLLRLSNQFLLALGQSDPLSALGISLPLPGPLWDWLWDT